MFGPIVNKLCSLFGTKPASRAARSSRFRPAVENLEERALMSLTPVNPGAAFPFSAIVKIQATFPDGKMLVGSGTMVDSFQVLTAGHAIYSAIDGGYARSVEVIPDEYVGANGQLVEPFGYAMAQKGGLQTLPAFMHWNQAHPNQFAYGNDDIGMISLDRNIGARTSWLSFGYFNSGMYSAGTIMDTAGYPTTGAPSYNGYHMEFGAGAIAGMSSDHTAILYYQSSIPTNHGQSGSPLWVTESNGTRVIVGVIVAAGNGTPTSLNAATCITPSIFQTLKGWMTTDHKPVGDPISYDPPSYVGSNSGGGVVYSFD